jgi:transposase
MANLQFAGIDVDDNGFHVALFDTASGQFTDFACRPTAAALVERLERARKPGAELRLCYEATHLGFCLVRQLRARGLACEVIAPSLIPELKGKAQKTNRLDARHLAKCYANGLLTVVHVPDADDEAERDLVRSRRFVTEMLTALKNHITGLAKRLGWDFRQETGKKSYWTETHRVWLSAKVESAPSQATKVHLRLLLGQLEDTLRTQQLYDTEIEHLAETPKYKAKVAALGCYRGIDTTTAMTLATEIGDVRRFSNPRRLTSYAGFDLREYSSGTKEQRFGISKLGNHHIRTAVIESCQFAFAPVRQSRALIKRRAGASPELVEIASRAMARLHKKGGRLIHRGKHRNVAKTACARELLTFVWESLMRVA